MLFTKEDIEYSTNFNTVKYINDNFDAKEKQIIERLDLLIVKEGDKTLILKCSPILLREMRKINQENIKKVERLTDLYEHDKYCMLLDEENMKEYNKLLFQKYIIDENKRIKRKKEIIKNGN